MLFSLAFYYYLNAFRSNASMTFSTLCPLPSIIMNCTKTINLYNSYITSANNIVLNVIIVNIFPICRFCGVLHLVKRKNANEKMFFKIFQTIYYF